MGARCRQMTAVDGERPKTLILPSRRTRRRTPMSLIRDGMAIKVFVDPFHRFLGDRTKQST